VTRWDDVALAKLTSVLGPEKGRATREELFAELGISSLASPDDLYTFAQRLLARGGFAAAVGGLLSVHAVIHGANGDAAVRTPRS